MNAVLREIVELAPFYHPCRNWWCRRKQSRDLEKWIEGGRPVPVPDLVKQMTLRQYAAEYDLRILVETGTCYGDMIEAMKDSFDRIYSIELSRELYVKARKRFRKRADVRILQGDSAWVLADLVRDIDAPALFWLDAHYSEGLTARGEDETPILRELESIFGAGPRLGHVVIIDDARCFESDPGYPTLRELKEFLLSKDPGLEIAVRYDSIRITMPRRRAF